MHFLKTMPQIRLFSKMCASVAKQAGLDSGLAQGRGLKFAKVHCVHVIRKRLSLSYWPSLMGRVCLRSGVGLFSCDNVGLPLMG